MRALVLACLLAVAPAASALAGEGDIRIRTAGLDLSDAETVAGLHAQIERAARKACGLDNTRLSAHAWRIRAACVEEKVDRAVAMANAPALSALHAALKPASRG